MTFQSSSQQNISAQCYFLRLDTLQDLQIILELHPTVDTVVYAVCDGDLYCITPIPFSYKKIELDDKVSMSFLNTLFGGNIPEPKNLVPLSKTEYSEIDRHIAARRPQYIVQSCTWTGDISGIAAMLSQDHHGIRGILIIATEESKPTAIQMGQVYKTLLSSSSLDVLILPVKVQNISDFVNSLIDRKSDETRYRCERLGAEDPIELDLRFLRLREVGDAQKAMSRIFSKTPIATQVSFLNTLKKKLNLASQKMLHVQDIENQTFLDTISYSLYKKTLFIWVRHSGLTDIHYESDTSNTMLRDIATYLQNNIGLYQQIVLVGDSCPKTAITLGSLLMPSHVFIDMTSWWSKSIAKQGGTDINIYYGQDRWVQTQLWAYIYEKQTQPMLHIGMRSGQLELLAYLGFYVNYIDHPESELPMPGDVVRIDNLATKAFNLQHFRVPPLTRKSQYFFTPIDPNVITNVVDQLMKFSAAPAQSAQVRDPLWDIIEKMDYPEKSNPDERTRLTSAVKKFITQTRKPYKDYEGLGNTLETHLKRLYGQNGILASHHSAIIRALRPLLYSSDLKKDFQKKSLTEDQIRDLLLPKQIAENLGQLEQKESNQERICQQCKKKIPSNQVGCSYCQGKTITTMVNKFNGKQKILKPEQTSLLIVQLKSKCENAGIAVVNEIFVKLQAALKNPLSDADLIAQLEAVGCGVVPASESAAAQSTSHLVAPTQIQFGEGLNRPPSLVSIINSSASSSSAAAASPPSTSDSHFPQAAAAASTCQNAFHIHGSSAGPSALCLTCGKLRDHTLP